MMKINDKLSKIQSELKAPKNQFNNFGKYKYRSCEDILEGLKTLLSELKCTVTLSDEIKQLGSIVFVESTVMFSDGESSISVKASAGIDVNKKGMDISQTFGSSSSYARKYALNGLFAIDDTKDADTVESKPEPTKTDNKPTEQQAEKPWLNEGTAEYKKVVEAMKKGYTIQQVRKKYAVNKKVAATLEAITKIESIKN